jgi:Na+/H+ antiporter NhaD/arsenite permease-like protein
MTFLIARYLKVNAVPFILGEVFVSNIGGAATLIGDPPNIIIASKANLDFNAFLIHMTPISVLVIAFIVPFLVWVFRKSLVNSKLDRDAIMKLDPSTYISNRLLLKKSLFVLLIVIAGFIGHSIFHIEPSLIAMMGAGLLVLISKLKPSEFAVDVEWGTLVFFAGLFVMVGALVNVGVLKAFADLISAAVDGNAPLAAGSLVVLSAVVSGIVDNIPYVASMIPVVQQLIDSMPSITNDGLWWALALGADFGGNMTIIGASANVVAIGLAHANGIKITFWQFAKYGIPVTVISTLLALPYVLIRYF